jgi:hypothetical protein
LKADIATLVSEQKILAEPEYDIGAVLGFLELLIRPPKMLSGHLSLN